MPVEIKDAAEFAQTDAQPAAGVPVPSKLKIAGADRDVMTAIIGGRAIVYTETLTVLERRALSRAMLPEDAGAPEAYGFNQAAARVRKIDGEAVAFPSNDAHLTRILTELGDEAAEFLYAQGIENYRKKAEEKAKNS